MIPTSVLELFKPTTTLQSVVGDLYFETICSVDRVTRMKNLGEKHKLATPKYLFGPTWPPQGGDTRMEEAVATNRAQTQASPLYIQYSPPGVGTTSTTTPSMCYVDMFCLPSVCMFSLLSVSIFSLCSVRFLVCGMCGFSFVLCVVFDH